MAISIRISSSRAGRWHSFAPADYATLLTGLLIIRERGGRFLEMGSGIGVIAIMADLLGIEACGIEIAPELVTEGRELAERYGSGAHFATGSFLPPGYQWISKTGDTRMGALGIGESAYSELGYDLADFDWVYAYPWPGETDVLHDVMQCFGAPDARLLLHGYAGGLESYSAS